MASRIPLGDGTLWILSLKPKPFPQTCRSPAPAGPCPAPPNLETGWNYPRAVIPTELDRGWDWEPRELVLDRDVLGRSREGSRGWQRCPIHAHGNEVLCAQKKPRSAEALGVCACGSSDSAGATLDAWKNLLCAFN